MLVTKVTGFRRLYYATKYSLQGLKAAFTSEPAVRQESAALLVGVCIAILLDISALERVLLIGSLLLLIVVELLNSAIEAVVDRIGAEIHELSGKAKDIGSAAVFVTIILVIMCWVSVIVPLFL